MPCARVHGLVGERWRLALLLALALVAGTGASAAQSADERVDVLVVGSEPEAIVAAVAAAESGARTLLLTEDRRLGGLFVLGELNVLDLRLTPAPYQRGLFERWWRDVGMTGAFDVDRAEQAFERLLRGAGVEVRRGVSPPDPWLEGDVVIGVVVDGRRIAAPHVIDGTADAHLAAAAGAGSTFGWSSLGFDARMADTLVFRIEGVDWGALRAGARARGRGYAYVDDHVAHGSFGGHPTAFRAQEPGIRLRGLNLGRQSDGSVLVNALLIHDVDPFDAASVDAAMARAAAEVPRIVTHLAEAIPGFANARPGGVAERLYVRQTRHLSARCTLTVDDVVDHVVTDQDVAAGGYPLDVQALRPSDDGFVFGLPEIYGVRLCMTVPSDLSGLWVVGRSAGFDPIAHSSARVVPLGMALAEAVGVAAALGAAAGWSSVEAASDPAAIAEARLRLAERGAYLPPVRPRRSAGPVDHPRYGAYRDLLRWGLAVPGYDNDPRLDAPVERTGLLYLLANLLQRVHGNDRAAHGLIARFGIEGGPLDADTAASMTASALCSVGPCPETSDWGGLQALGLALPRPAGPLTRGDVYALGAAMLAAAGTELALRNE